MRKPGDLAGIRGLIIPGGESTTMENLARRCGLFDALREAAGAGLPGADKLASAEAARRNARARERRAAEGKVSRGAKATCDPR